MSTVFKQLISSNTPVLLNFYTTWSEDSQTMDAILRDVVAAVGDKGRVIKINIEKNQDLIRVLKISSVPTLILYKNSEMVWRKNGVLEANALIYIFDKYQ